MKKKILGTSDTWSTSRLSHRPSDPAYYIVDCRISDNQIKYENSVKIMTQPSDIPDSSYTSHRHCFAMINHNVFMVICLR